MAAKFARLLSRHRSWGDVGAAAGAAAICSAGPAASCQDKHDYSHQDSHQEYDGHKAAHDGVGHGHADMPARYIHTHKGDERGAHLVFGIPKKGRLYEQVSQLLRGSGIEYTRKDRVDIASSHNLPMSLVFLPAKDIATYVAEGEVDLGITGEDCVAESEADVDVLMQLGFGRCNLSVQGSKNLHVTAESLAGKRIVTSFPKVAEKFFKTLEQSGQPTQIKCISGSVEAAIALGLADGIVDLVETGTTMRAAGLEEVEVVMTSEAVLIKSRHSKHPELVELIRKRIAGFLRAQSWVMVTYNVRRVNLRICEDVTPGSRSPSIQPLEDKDWVAVAALVPKKKAAHIMDELALHGAEDILLTGLLSTRIGD